MRYFFIFPLFFTSFIDSSLDFYVNVPIRASTGEVNPSLDQKSEAQKTDKDAKPQKSVDAPMPSKTIQKTEKTEVKEDEWDPSGLLFTKQKKRQSQNHYFQGSLSLSHYAGIKEDLDPLSFINLTGFYYYKKIHSIRISQSFTKLYIVDGEESIIQLADLVFDYRYKFKTRPFNWNTSFTIGASLPFSAFSRRQGVLSKLNSSVFFSKAFFFNRLNLSFAPFTYLHWNRYKTTLSNPGDNGGRPLRKYRLGFSFNPSLRLIDNLRFNFPFTWMRNYYEISTLKNALDPYGNETNPPNHSYSFAPHFSYQWNNMSLLLGFDQRNFAETVGGIEVVLLDVEKSYYFVAFNYQI